MEGKGKKFGYSGLVIILFAALAFVTVFNYVDWKTRNCNCPECFLNDNKVYSYEDVAGHYIGYPTDFEQDNNVSSLTLYSDGTFTDSDANIKPGMPGLEEVDEVKYLKDSEYSSDINGFDSAMETLNRYYIERY